MKHLVAIIVSASWLTGCTVPDHDRESYPTVKGSYRCATAATRRAVPTPELGARQTSEGFLRWSTTFDQPARCRLAAALGERMGQLEYTWVEDGQSCLKTDPREAYSGLGSMERVSWAGPDERLAASFIAKDVAVGLPALVDSLCARGVESVSYKISL